MIFVTVGSTAPFDSLVMEVDRLVGEGVLEGGMAQIGKGFYIPRNLKWFRFRRDLTAFYEQADLIITHGGAGTIFEILQAGKKAIAVPNPDAIQNPDILIKMSREGHILYCPHPKLLRHFIESSKNWLPRRYVAPPCLIHEVIIKYLL
ncbi:MAG: glycosyltransferase [Candidatus Methanomethylicaceae archaeon]